MLVGIGAIEATGQPLRALALALGTIVGRPVVDMTFTPGQYDFTLTFTPERGTAATAAPDAPSAASDAPSIFTALQEQLGLKLEHRREPVDVVVIDHIERPQPD